jgi:hypothetical protein
MPDRSSTPATRATGSGQVSTARTYRGETGPRRWPFRHPGDDNVERETNVNEHERRALNESLFRDVNERIAESAENLETDKTEFVCECADPSCTERVPATLAEYENVRKKSTTFLLAPGHGEPDIEQVVSDRGRFQVVEKMGEVVRRTVIRLDPRTRPRPSES